MAEESALMNVTPQGRAARVVKAILPRTVAKISAEKPEKTMTGPGFWILVAVTSFDELILDLFTNLTVVFAIFVLFTGILVAVLTVGYLYFSGVHMDVRVVASMAVTLMIEIMPFLSILPTSVLSLFYIRHLEHKKYEKKLEEYEKRASSESRAAPSPV